MPVGLLRCQNDPLCKELTTVVHSAKRASVAEDTGELWHVLLQDTIIFPEGGGQPSDTGTLQLFESFEGSQPAELSIVSAFRRNLDAVHMVHIPSGVPAQNLLQRGAKVLVKVDWQRREDHMQQHTGQHLLSAYLDSLDPPLPTLSWGLAAWPQPCYVELPRAPTDAELESVRAQLSASIKRGHSITVTVESMEQVAHAPPKLPQDYVAGADGAGDDVNSQGVIRTVNIDGIDANPCCGTHWPSLRFLHYIHIYPGTSKIRGSNVRLYFDVGRRAFHNLLESFDVAASISRTLGCARGETTARLDMLMAKEKGARKRELQLKEEVA
ncbi:ThrRS/AlaRS common domain-containing protein, partial [Tilletiaria anomala UBC 951]